MANWQAQIRAQAAQAWRAEVEYDLQFYDNPLEQVKQWLAQAKDEQNGALEDWWMYTLEVRRLTAMQRELEKADRHRRTHVLQ